MSAKFEVPDFRLTPALEVKFDGAQQGVVEGYASTFEGLPDSYGDVIAKGAFTKSLERIAAEGRALPMLWSHQTIEPIGTWSELHEDDAGLFVRGRLNGEVERAREVRALAMQGAVSGLSIGYSVPEGGRKRAKDGSFILTEISLMEISLCVFPASRSARLAEVKVASKRELIDALREGRPFAKSAATRIAGGGFAALIGGDDDDDDTDKLMRALRQSASRLRKG